MAIFCRVSLTYGQYLRVGQLLDLQQPLSDEHDEMLFIVIHQVYELWFKQQIHEIDHACACLQGGDGGGAATTLRRMLTILKTMVAQIDVLETITPTGFLSFRARLENASGFQSWQFRAFEFALGNRRSSALGVTAEGSPERNNLQKRLGALTIWQSMLAHLAKCGHPIPSDRFATPADKLAEPDPVVQEVLLSIYRAGGELHRLCELLVDLDEGVQEWRYRHVKMVERTIGFKRGTGGSSGAEYLRTTLFRPAFPDLWEIRTRL